MKLAIMQPYFCAYIGYYQLIDAADLFVLYDNIEYTKRGWFNRNRILLNGTDRLFTIPIRKDSDYLNVNQRYLAKNSEKSRKKILSRIAHAYRKAPYFSEVYGFVEAL
ncbi:MAG: WbqC family protein, partial [Saprospiraceae bacterium]|nr:WbqC family protein [Saprospiraceae bacterium]